jgi:hypothetical protein
MMSGKLGEPWCRDPFVHIDIIVENQYVHYKPCNVYAKSYDHTRLQNNTKRAVKW